MAQIHYYRDIDGTLVDMSAYAPRLQWVAQSKAEEGAVGSWTVALDDPDGTLDILPHRQWFIEDDESEDDDDIVWGGFTGGLTIAKMADEGRRPVGPAARVVVVDLVDANTWLSRILMRGSDCKRPLETDVQRMTWLLSTAEAGLLTDTSTYVDTTGPKAMDKGDLRGTYFGQVVADCASASGKNYFVWYRKVAGVRTLTIWYGRDTLPDYPSPLYLTNDATVLRGGDVDPDIIDDVYPLSADAQLKVSGERQYCGNYITYGDKGAATYRHRSATHAKIASYGSGHRDMTSNFPLVKTKAKAQARGDRQLADVEDPDLRITTRLVDIPSTRVTLAKAGMRLQVEGTHWGPWCDDWHYARIVTAQPKPHSDGSLYDIDLELVLGDDSPGPPAPPYEGDVFAGLVGSTTDTGGYGTLQYGDTYDSPAPAGWDEQDTEGPIAILAADPHYYAIQVSEPMVVRIYAQAWASGVAIPAVDRSMYVLVNGVIVATATHTLGPGGVSTFYQIDLRNYSLAAGDVVSIYSQGAVFWSNIGTNATQFIVCRGTFPSVNLVNKNNTGVTENPMVGP